MKGLTRIDIAGFKSIREMSLELRPLNVLIGANGTGKSNFLSFFKLMHETATAKRLRAYVIQQGGANAILHHGMKRTGDIRAQMVFAGLNSAGQIHLTAIPALDRIDVVEQRMDLDHACAYVDWRVYHFHDTSPTAPMRLTGDIHDNRYLRADGRNLAAFLYMLRQTRPAYYDKIRDVIRRIAPFFDDFVLEPARLNPQKILLEWAERDSEGYASAANLSDGTLRFMCLATLLLQPELPDTILIDEPELGLHPSAIRLLAGMVRVAAQRSQVIVSTQSVTLIDEMEDPEDIVVVEREDGQSVFKRLARAELDLWIEEYSLGEPRWHHPSF